jgi:DDE family transposase
LEDVAPGDELWFRDELLAKIARLASGGHLATDPLRLARLARALRTDRLVTGSGGRQFRASGFWGLQTGPNPTDRAKLGSKRHLICDGQGIPLAVQVTGANRNDSQQALALVDAIPSLQESGDDRAIVLIACSATVVVTLRQSGKVCVPAASCLGSQSATLNMAAGCASGDG